MRILQLYLAALLIGIVSPLMAQGGGKISGRVLDAATNPLPGANVIVKGTSRGGAADANGFFFIVNLPPGSYDLESTMIGYNAALIEGVVVVTSQTTKLDIELSSAVIGMEQVVVQGYKAALVQKDQTFKVQSFTKEELRDLPVTDVSQILEMQAGITRDIQTTPVSGRAIFGQFATIPTDGLHFRGGRSNETLYLFDGINIKDGIWGGFKMSAMGEGSFQSMETFSGTFGPQYGEAMSGVLNMASSGTLAEEYKFEIKTYTDRLGPDESSQNTGSFEWQATGPVPGIKRLSFNVAGKSYSTDGYISGYLYPNYVDSEGLDKSGDVELVPMQFRQSEYSMAKLLWQPFESVKISAGGFQTRANEGVYNHYFKYNPYGTPRVVLSDRLSYLKINHVLSPKTFYTITLASYLRDFGSYVWDDSSSYLVIPQYGSNEFAWSGEDWVYFKTKFERREIKFDFASQITKSHKLEIGINVDNLGTYLERRNPDGWDFYEFYDLKPNKYAGYFNDKMEFEDIGMIVNAGLRVDYIDPNRDFVLDITDPDGEIGPVKARSYISPRLGVSYPITDVAAFHFGYGHYYQFPDFYKVFQGLDKSYGRYPQPDVTNISSAIALGDINEERTVNYEVGVQIKIGENTSFNTTGFYRKISNLIGTTLITDNIARKFTAFDNIDFATVKGIEISIKKHYADNFSAFLNYTFSQSLVSSSQIFQRTTDISRTYPSDWDQPHVLSLNLAYKISKSWGFDLYGSMSSGLPYTFNVQYPNAEQAPWIHSLDLLVYRESHLFGINQRLFLQIFNVPNRKNVWWVYSDSGKPGVDAQDATSDDYTNNPSMWGPGRQIILGISFGN